MSKEYTPGPWVASNNPGDWGLGGNWTVSIVPHDYDATIAEIPYQTPYCLGEKQSIKDKAATACANAHLIAAAPDLLEALVMALEDADGSYDGGDLSFEWVAIARAAIAKARGQ